MSNLTASLPLLDSSRRTFWHAQLPVGRSGRARRPVVGLWRRQQRYRRTGLGNVLLARTGQDTAVGLGAACTHEGNLVTNFTGAQIVCPVHRSQFNVSGTVARGPATRALPTYPATLASGVVSVTV